MVLLYSKVRFKPGKLTGNKITSGNSQSQIYYLKSNPRPAIIIIYKARCSTRSGYMQDAYKYLLTMSRREKGAKRNLEMTFPVVSHDIFAPFFLFPIILLTRKGAIVSGSFARIL